MVICCISNGSQTHFCDVNHEPLLPLILDWFRPNFLWNVSGWWLATHGFHMRFGCFYLPRDSSSCIALCSMHSPLAFTVALLVLLMTFSCMLVVFEVCCCSLLVKWLQRLHSVLHNFIFVTPATIIHHLVSLQHHLLLVSFRSFPKQPNRYSGFFWTQVFHIFLRNWVK